MDSGGGQWLHISAELVLVLMRHRCKAYILKPYTTSALCALDQDCHRCWSQQWAQVKNAWAKSNQSSMNVYQALAANREIAKDALSPKRGAVSWHVCGFDPDKPLQRDKVLIERRDEVLKSIRGNAQEVTPPSSKNQAALDIVATISPPKGWTPKKNIPSCIYSSVRIIETVLFQKSLFEAVFPQETVAEACIAPRYRSRSCAAPKK